MTDSFRTGYLASKRKKRMLSQMMNIDLIQECMNEQNKKIKVSKRDQLKELKLVQYFENLLISKDILDDIQMDSYRAQIASNLSTDEMTQVDYDIKIETNMLPCLWDSKNLISFLDYEKVYILLLRRL